MSLELFDCRKCKIAMAWLSVFIISSLLTTYVLIARYRETALIRTYNSIDSSTTLSGLEKTLGPGQCLQKDQIPESPDYSNPMSALRSRPVIVGTLVFQWKDNYGNILIISVSEHGTVCDKWYSGSEL